MKFYRNLLISCATILFGIALCFGWNNSVQAATTTSQWHGLNYDYARQPATVSQVESMIRSIAKHHGNYIKLHLTDDNDFAIESETLGQTVSKYPNQKNGLYYNTDTGNYFMSKYQLGQLIKYGQANNVTVIPEIDVPGHSAGLHQVLANINPTLDKAVWDSNNNQLRYGNDNVKQLVKALFDEYLPMVPKGSPIGTGGDELIANTTTAETQLAAFDNFLSGVLGDHPMWMYNDSARNATYKTLNPNIVIEFWSQSEDKDATDTAFNLAHNASAETLTQNGRKVINSNSYYLYLIADDAFIKYGSFAYYKNDLKKHWGENVFNQTHYYDKIKASKNIIGSEISIWQDDNPKWSADKTITELMPWVTAFLDRVHNQKLTLS